MGSTAPTPCTTLQLQEMQNKVEKLTDAVDSLEKTAIDKNEFRAVLAELRQYIDQALYRVDSQVEKLVGEVRTAGVVARDSMAITVGVDGKNGLRGNVSTMRTDVDRISHDVTVMREILENSQALKKLLIGTVSGAVMFGLVQIIGITWFFSSEHAAQESLTRDVVEINVELREYVKENNLEFKALRMKQLETLEALRSYKKQD